MLGQRQSPGRVPAGVRVGDAGARIPLDQRHRAGAAVHHGLPDRGAHPRVFYAAEAYQQYWFGWVRFIHFLCAYVYVFNFLARLYWGFVGNKYAKWNNFFPLTEGAAAGDRGRDQGRRV